MKFLPALLLLVLTAARLRVVSTAPVTPDEAFQWLTALRLDWAFFDAPGGAAAMARLGMTLFGDTPFGLRFTAPLFALLASVGAGLLGRALFGTAAGLWAAAALNVLPAFNAAATEAGPAMPALAFTLLAAWAFVRAMEHGRSWWILAGVLTGTGAQFLYAANAVVAGVLLVCLLPSRHRAEWRRPGIYAALMLVGIAAVPAVRWNQSHGWPATGLGTWHTELALQWPEAAAAFTATISNLSVPGAMALLAGLGLLVPAIRIHARPRLFFGLLLPFAVLWLRDIFHGEANAARLLLATGIASAGVASVLLRPGAWRMAGAVALVLTAGFAAFSPAPRRDDWKPLAETLAPLLERAQAAVPPGSAPVFLIAPDPASTAALGYHLSRVPGAHPVYLRESQDLSNQFGLWPRYDDFVKTDRPADEFFQLEGNVANPNVGRSALYLTDEEPDDLPQTITAAFRRVAPFAALTLPGDRKMRVYLCEDYQTMPL